MKSDANHKKAIAMRDASRRMMRLMSVSVIVVTSVTYMPTHAQSRYMQGDALEAEAWNDASGTLNLDEVQVTASLSSLQSAKASRIVTVITREEIESMPASSITDILKLSSSVDVRQRAGFGVQADISIDGGTYDQVSILLNGVNITSAQTGHYSGDWPVAVDDIERIEIIEGAASRYMGASSLMGAINIVTRRADNSQATVKVEGGSFGTVGAFGSLSLASKGIHNAVSGGYQRSDGGTVNSEFSRGQAYYNGQYLSDAIDVSAQVGWSTLSHGANTFYSGAYPDQHDAITRYVASIGAETKGKFKVASMVYWLRLVDHYQLVRNTPKGETFHRGDTYGARFNAIAQWRWGRTTIGAELRRESILSTNLGKPLQQDQYVAANDSVDYTHKDARTTLSITAEQYVALGDFNFSAGLVAARNIGLDSKFRVYPGVDAAYHPNRQWRLYASFGQSFRMPTFTDLYYKAPTHEGNRDLLPEKITSWQLGAQYGSVAYGVRANAFYHRGNNMIDWVMYTPGDVFHATGFDLDNMGITLQGQVRLQQIFGERQPFNTIDFNYTYMHQKRRDKQEIYESRAALEYLKHKFTASLSHKLWRGATAVWTLRYADRMGDFLLYANGQSQGRLEPYRPYAVLDLKIDYRIGVFDLYLSASNLTNHRYYDCANIPQPGLWIMGGAKIMLNMRK